MNSQVGEAQYLTADVPAFARRTLDAADGPDSLAVAGLSTGGTCSVVLALRHPAEYSTFASYSGFAQPTDENDDVATSIRTRFGGAAARFAAHGPSGSSTAPLPGPPGLVRGRRGRRRPAASRGHDAGLWSQALTDSLPWISWPLGLTGRPDGVPATCRPPVG